MARKQKLLDLMVERFPTMSRDQLYRHIMCSEVTVDGAFIRDPSYFVAPTVSLELHRRRYVSRGGDKLAAALKTWNVPVAGKSWLDAGASTGGFTDALLQAGAAMVHTVDVGYNQLDFSLRRDPRVSVHERTNINDVTGLVPPPDAAVCDLSFRSLRGVLSHILELTREGWGIALLKPQFEAAAELRWGRSGTAEIPGGVVAPDQRDDLIARAVGELALQGVEVIRMMDSPVPGTRGNREVLLHVYLRRSAARNGSPIYTPSPPR